MGRPSDYSDALADTICEMLIEGRSLRQICKEQGFPDRNTVFRWLEKHEDFAAKYARARALQGDLMDDLIYETAEACTAETAMADRVKIGAYQWRASKLRPKVYGDKVQTEVSGPDGGPIQSNIQADAAAVAFMLRKALEAKGNDPA